MSSYIFSEEAFVYSSISEIVNVWKRGNGQDSLFLDINEGSAELKMSFSFKQHVPPCDQLYARNDKMTKIRPKRKSPFYIRREQRRALKLTRLEKVQQVETSFFHFLQNLYGSIITNQLMTFQLLQT